MRSKFLYFPQTQGFALSAIPMLVKGVPSMHVCLDMVPELLSQPILSQPRAFSTGVPSQPASIQVFAMHLAAHLCKQYAVQKALDLAKFCFSVATTFLSGYFSTLSHFVIPIKKPLTYWQTKI